MGCTWPRAGKYSWVQGGVKFEFLDTVSTNVNRLNWRMYIRETGVFQGSGFRSEPHGPRESRKIGILEYQPQPYLSRCIYYAPIESRIPKLVILNRHVLQAKLWWTHACFRSLILLPLTWRSLTASPRPRLPGQQPSTYYCPCRVYALGI